MLGTFWDVLKDTLGVFGGLLGVLLEGILGGVTGKKLKTYRNKNVFKHLTIVVM